MNPDTHLTPDQIDDHLIGDLSRSAAEHLAFCDHCQTLVTEAEAPLATFNAVSLAWAERRSATLPVPTPAQARPPHRLAWASLGTAATAAIALAVALPLLHHAPAATPQPVTIASTSSDEIASDNAMLAAVDQALNAPIERPASIRHDHTPANLLQQ
jgi:hypothetical protein